MEANTARRGAGTNLTIRPADVEPNSSMSLAHCSTPPDISRSPCQGRPASPVARAVPGRIDCAAFRREMEQVIDRVTLDPYADLEGFLDECATGAAEWPWLLRSVLRSFARWGNDGGALVLTGLPVEQYLPPTPVGQLQTLAGRPGITEKLLAGVAACFGAELIAYAQHLGGAVFQDVGPDPKEELVQSSASSIKALLSHTEDAFHPYRPRFLMLACERPDHERRALVIPKDSDIFHS